MNKLCPPVSETRISQDPSLIASFRDPAGSVLRVEGLILRVINPAGVRDLNAVLQSPVAQKLIASGALVGTRAVDEIQNEGSACQAGGARRVGCAAGADGGGTRAHRISLFADDRNARTIPVQPLNGLLRV
jgi:hypothetical protein